MSANLTDVRLSTPQLSGDAALAEVRPGAVGELDGTALVGAVQTLTVSAVGAEGEPECVVPSAVIHIGRDLGTTRLPVGENAVVTVGEYFRAGGTENNHRRELSAGGQRLHVLVDDVVVNGRADLSSGIGYETVQREDLTDRAAVRRIGRQPRRRSRSRSDGRHGKKQPTGSLPAGRWQTRTKQAEATRQGKGLRSHAPRLRAAAGAVDQGLMGSMFIRRTQTRRTEDGKPYFSHRLVHAERLGSSVRQRTLLNLGRHFDIPQADWPLLCARINDALSGQAPLVADCPPAVEEEAQRIAAQLIARGAAAPTAGLTDVQPVDVDSLRLVRPRSVGVEQVGLWALEQLDLPALLTRLGVNGALRSAATGAIVGRLAAPASERATHRWLQERSGLGELLGVDFETVGAMQLYRASDVLVKHREAIEAHLFDRAMGLFDLQPTVTLYDLTNTYFEGEASDQPQAQRGHSKEKRSDCPLLTLGLMLDASGFVRRSKVFAGNVREHRTLAGMLEALEAPVGALVVMDRGVATDACVTWLRDNGYRYLVVSRERHRRFDADAAVSLQTQSDQTVHMHKVVSTDPDEVRLYCYSEERANKERGIVERFAARFETALTKLNDGLSRPRAHKRLDQVWQRIGRLKAKHSRVASHYQITVTANEAGDQAVAVNWTRRPQDGSMVTHPGVYCLRSSETDWNEDALWRTYTTLTDVEAVFRSLKSELGLRPIYHRKPARADGHLFITVIAYQLVQVIRTRLRARREHARWTTLRRVLEGQQRVTATFRRPDGRTLHVRTATQAEPDQRAIYDALGVDPHPGGVRKTLV